MNSEVTVTEKIKNILSLKSKDDQLSLELKCIELFNVTVFMAHIFCRIWVNMVVK